jgi:hypothetical protein
MGSELMSTNPFVWLLIAVFLTYMLGWIGYLIWIALFAKGYKFTRRPPEPPDGTPGSS